MLLLDQGVEAVIYQVMIPKAGHCIQDPPARTGLQVHGEMEIQYRGQRVRPAAVSSWSRSVRERQTMGRGHGRLGKLAEQEVSPQCSWNEAMTMYSKEIETTFKSRIIKVVLTKQYAVRPNGSEN